MIHIGSFIYLVGYIFNNLLNNKQILEETEKERRLLRDLYQRHTELQKLENSIKEVHSLFIRIQNLVLEQVSLCYLIRNFNLFHYTSLKQNDRIQMVEFHAQQASVHVDKGAVELDKAHTLKKRGLKVFP